MSKTENIKLVDVSEIKSADKKTPAPKVKSGDINFDKFVQEAMATVFKSKEK